MSKTISADEVIKTYKDLLFRIAVHYAKNKTEAEDIVQETFIKWAIKSPNFASHNHEKAWFIRVTINLCKNHLRSFWITKNIPYEDGLEIKMSDTKYSLINQVRQLRENYRIVIYLYYYEGYSLVEIANILKKNVSTIQTWHLRAKKKLKEMIGDKNEI